MVKIIKFSIEYKTKFAFGLFISGECEELGQWNIGNALRMQWTEGHVWQATIPISQKIIQYKYFVASYDDKLNEILWEKGPNRIYQYQDDSDSRKVDDIWEHRHLRFLYKNKNQYVYQIQIYGSCYQLGNFLRGYQMQKKEYFSFDVLINVNEDQEILYYFEIYIYDDTQKYKIKKTQIKNINIGFQGKCMIIQIQFKLKKNKQKQDHYENNIMIVQKQCKNQPIFKLDDKVYYGQIPRTDSDFEIIKQSDIKIVVEFVQEFNKSVVPIQWETNDMKYMQINILALELKFGQQIQLCLINLMKRLQQLYNSFFVCNNSLTYLRKYLHVYSKVASKIPEEQSYLKASQSFILYVTKI